MYFDFEKLEVWQKAHDLTLRIYKVTKEFPRDEIYGLTSQIRRSAASVATNIVEGKARSSKADYLKFLVIARGSLEETRYHLILARDLDYITLDKYTELSEAQATTARLLGGLIRSLKA